MPLSLAEVQDVAHLARLRLNPEEQEIMRAQLSKILDAIELLQEVDVSGVPPTYQVTELTSVFRPDDVSLSLSPAEALANAPERRDNLFLVKAVFEEEDAG